MSEYTPDRWVAVEIRVDDQRERKILAGWYGGFAGSDEWRLSSGIVKVQDQGDYYEVDNHSGSVYTCYKSAEGMSSLMRAVYCNFADSATETSSIEIIKL